MQCLQSLFLSNPQDDLAAIRSAKGDRVPGTCEWVLTQDQYGTWKVEDGLQLLWLSGGPGIGKTMLSSFLVEELVHLAERSSQITLAYYFCDNKDERRRTATAILRGLLLQLLRQRPMLFKHIQAEFDTSRDNLFTNFYALWRIFVGIVQDHGVGEVYCLVDALDECEKESRQLLLKSLSKLFGPYQNRKTSVKFIVTSRPESDITEILSAIDPAVLRIHVDSGRVNHDLQKFINVKVDELSKTKRYKSGLRDKIRDALTDKAGGTFLYVSLVLHDLQKITISAQVTQKLKELPSDLNKMYDRILSLVDADCADIAKMVLRWVAVARRPLTVEELAMALTLGTGTWEKSTMPPEDLLDEFRDGYKCCEPFVYVDTRNYTINLVHQSAKDYLLGKHLQGKDDLSHYHVDLDEANHFALKTCWAYMSLPEFKNGTELIDRYEDNVLLNIDISDKFRAHHCFLQYASPEWQKHALLAGPVVATSCDFRKESLDQLPTLRDTWLLQAAGEGQKMVVQRLLEEGAELESRNEYGQTSLSVAAEGGHEAVVELLLSRDDVIEDSQDDISRTPLSYAAESGCETVVRLLLSQENVAADSRDKIDRTPLWYATRHGYEAIVSLLLSREDVAADSRDDNDRTQISYAAESGDEAV